MALPTEAELCKAFLEGLKRSPALDLGNKEVMATVAILFQCHLRCTQEGNSLLKDCGLLERQAQVVEAD